VVVLPLDKHAENEANRKEMLKDLDRLGEKVKELQQKVGVTSSTEVRLVVSRRLSRMRRRFPTYGIGRRRLRT